MKQRTQNRRIMITNRYIFLVVLLHLFGVISYYHQVNAKTYETDDAIIVEADTTEPKSRAKRDIIIRDLSITPVTTWGNKFGEGGACVTANAKFGQCMSFKSCYPYFKKLPDLSVFDTWVLGQYDTCTFYTDDGRQAIGVCCNDPPRKTDSSPAIPAVDDNIVVSSNVYSNWPPPYITHPPNHAAPTHPTIASNWPAGIAQYPSTSKYPTNKPTVQWPPPYPTHSTASPISIATSKFPSQSDPVGNHCGLKNGNQDQERIVGGQNAQPNEYPWIAVLFNNGRQFCGGSLIDSSHILTAAHCVAHMTSSDVSRLIVHLGDHNIRTKNEVPHIEKRVKRVVRHRSFDGRTLYNDVALLTLESPVQYTKAVRPICLPHSSEQFGGRNGVVIGWGSLRENGPQPSVLQKVMVPIWTNQQCRLKYGGAAPGGIVDHMICAGQSAQDSCSGDSGGPLMVNNGGTFYQVGVVSWGIGCGQGRYPGVYSRVTSFLPWIQKNLQTK